MSMANANTHLVLLICFFIGLLFVNPTKVHQISYKSKKMGNPNVTGFPIWKGLESELLLQSTTSRWNSFLTGGCFNISFDGQRLGIVGLIGG